MKSEEEIHVQHDVLSALMDSGELRRVLSDNELIAARSAIDVMCWVLDHDNKQFASFMAFLNATAKRHGLMVLVKMDS